MSEVAPFLLVTIDTECDKTATWHAASPLSFRGVVEVVPELLQPLFAEFGIRPTYLLSPEVMTHADSCSVLRDARGVELGTHLHGENVLPQMRPGGPAGSRTADMQWEYEPQLEREKLAVLTELFVQQFGGRPKSFRAGRFGAGRYTGRFLRELGYLVDSSVTPHIRWTSPSGKSRPDYRWSREAPYTLGREGDIRRPGEGGLLEVPITIVAEGDLERTRSERPLWFRPWHSDADGLARIMDHVLAEPAWAGVRRPLVMMFHNVELIPGASPYPQTAEDVRRYIDMLKRVFEHAERRGLRSCTMHEYHTAFMAGVPAGPGDPRAPGVGRRVFGSLTRRDRSRAAARDAR